MSSGPICRGTGWAAQNRPVSVLRRPGAPEGPTLFLNRKFPAVTIVRSTETTNAAQNAVKSLVDDGLFIGQVPEFFEVLNDLAEAADAAQNENLR